MKNSYEVRAQKFIRMIYPYIKNCRTVQQYRYAMRIFLKDHTNRRVTVCCGISRVAIITSDYVVKIDYNPDDEFGCCTTEMRGYELACDAGFEEYFAKITRFIYEGHNYYIMPRIRNIDEDDYDVEEYLDREVREWVRENFFDLHSGNYGWKDGHPVIFDYAANY